MDRSKNGMLITAFACAEERSKSNGGSRKLHRKRSQRPPVINSDNRLRATRRAGSQRKQTAILHNPSSKASATQLHCRCKRIVMQRLTGAACSGTVFCLAKCRFCGRSAAGRSSLLKPYLPNSCKLHEAMGTGLTARLFHRYGHFACIFPDTFRIISHRNPACQVKQKHLFVF